MKVIKYIILIFSFLPVGSLYSQNVMTSSPYSMFGMGEIVSGLYGQNSAMGGVAYGIRDSWIMNSDNPAGLTALDSMKLYAELSGFIKAERYSSKGSSNNAFTGNASAFSIGARIVPRWYAAVGIKPYTSVGYYFISLDQVAGTDGSYSATAFQGNGGLSKAYLTNAFKLPYNFSVGVNLNYIFGNIDHSETLSTAASNQNLYTQTLNADFGLQYYRAIGKNTFLTLGGVYGYEQKIKFDNTLTVVGSNTQTDYRQRRVTQYLPQFYGGGGSLVHKKMTYAVDYTFYEYSKWTSSSSQVKFQDVHEIRTGICFDPDGQQHEKYLKKMKYKAGFDFSTPYYKINSKSGIAWRASAGMAFPILGGYLNTALYYDRMQINGNNLQKSIIGLTVTYTISERMYRVKL